MKKIIVKSLFSLYDKLQGGELNKMYKLVKDRHERQQLINPDMITKYLLQSGYKGKLHEQPLMTKQDIAKKMLLVDENKIHTYAYTGGSYGEPFKIPYSKERANLRTASFKYFNEAAGYHLGEPFMLIAAKEKPKWWQFLRNEYRFVPKSLSEDKISKAVGLIVKKQISTVIGFPSVTFELANFIQKNKIKHPINTVVFTSEPIDEQKRSFIKNALHCNVIDRYSNEEVGLIAQQKEFGGAYYTNRFNVVVEVLDDELKPVREGEVGRVVVTDLCADLVPMIRYDTGDLAIAHEYRDGQLIALRSISGRVTEQLFCTNGAPIASLALGPLIHKPLTTANYYNQFQFAQTDVKHYELRIKDGQKLPKAIVQTIEQNLKDLLGHDATITTLFLADIKPQPSGKRPIYKNEMRARCTDM
jgi:phenylacetate-CoA ligase